MRFFDDYKNISGFKQIEQFFKSLKESNITIIKDVNEVLNYINEKKSIFLNNINSSQLPTTKCRGLPAKLS